MWFYLQTIAVGYFTHQRLVYINSTATELAPKVKLLDPLLVDLHPVTQELESLEQDAKNLNRKVLSYRCIWFALHPASDHFYIRDLRAYLKKGEMSKERGVRLRNITKWMEN